MNKSEASTILETVIDSLIEAGNGITEADLHRSDDLLLKFRDEWFNHALYHKVVRHKRKTNTLCKPPSRLAYTTMTTKSD